MTSCALLCCQLPTPLSFKMASFIRPLARAPLRAALQQPTPCFTRSFVSKSSQPRSNFLHAFKSSGGLGAFRRPASTFNVPSLPPQAYSREWWMRIAGTAGTVAAGAVAINYFANRETRVRHGVVMILHVIDLYTTGRLATIREGIPALVISLPRSWSDIGHWYSSSNAQEWHLFSNHACKSLARNGC